MTYVLIGLLAGWTWFCTVALADAGVPYQCGTDTECEFLHGRMK